MGASLIPLMGQPAQINSPVQTATQGMDLNRLAGQVAIQRQTQQENALKLQLQQQQFTDQQELNKIISQITPSLPATSAAQPDVTNATGAAPSAKSAALTPSAIPASIVPAVSDLATPARTTPAPTDGVGSSAAINLNDKLMNAVMSNPNISYAGKMATLQHNLDLQKAIAANNKETIANTAAQHNQTVGLIESVLQATPESQPAAYVAARAQGIRDKNPDAVNWPATFPGIEALTQARSRYMLGTELWKDAENLPDKQKSALGEFAQQMPAIAQAQNPAQAYQQAINKAPWYIRQSLPQNYSAETIDTVMKMGLSPQEQVKLPGELAESDQRIAGANAAKLAQAAAQGPDKLEAALSKLPPDQAQRFQGLTAPSDILRAGLTAEQAIKIPQSRTPQQWSDYVNSVVDPKKFPDLNQRTAQAVQFALTSGGVAGQEQAQKAVEGALNTVNEIGKETDPNVIRSKIATTVAEAKLLRQGDNPAVANVPPAAVAKVQSDAIKLDQDYLTAKESADAVKNVLDLTKSGNVAAGAAAATVGTEAINAINGIKRINPQSVAQYGNAGSLLQKIQGSLDKVVEGKPFPDSVLKDMQAFQDQLSNTAYQKYTQGLSSLNKRTNAQFQPAFEAPVKSAPAVPPLPTKLSQSDVGKVYVSPKTGQAMKITQVNPKDPTQFQSEVVKQ
jgi:hypothetical protein